MAQRLLLEMLAADGIAWAQRYEALVRLFRHPTGGPASIDACASAAGLRHHQAMISTVAALGASDHADSITALVSQAHDPTNDRALTGAVAGLAETVWRGRLDPGQRNRVMTALQPLAGSHDDLDAHATQILQSLSTTARQPHQPGPLPPPDDPQRHVTDRIAGRTVAQLDSPDSVDHADLSEMVHCMLFHPSADSRLAASFTLATTPYRRPLAAALKQELASGATLAGPARWSTTILAALRAIGGEPELRLAERIVMASGIPAETIRVAAFAIAHLGESTPVDWWQRAIEHRLSALKSLDTSADVEILRGLTYSAGITGQRAALEQMRSDPRTPFDSQAAATWWLDLPAHVLTSAHR
jgi:hypothetical protein